MQTLVIDPQRSASAPAQESREDRSAADRRPHDARSSTSSRATRAAAKESSRSSSRSCDTGSRTSSASAPTSRVWAAASGRAAPARRSSKSIGAASARASPCSIACLRTCGGIARCAARRSRREPLVALVGYTNVGKSSLLNALARSRRARRRPAVCDARSDDPASLRQARILRAARRYGRIHHRSPEGSWSTPSARRWKSCATPTCCCTSSTPAIRDWLEQAACRRERSCTTSSWIARRAWSFTTKRDLPRGGKAGAPARCR